jgi:hypothetical protein
MELGEERTLWRRKLIILHGLWEQGLLNPEMTSTSNSQTGGRNAVIGAQGKLTAKCI